MKQVFPKLINPLNPMNDLSEIRSSFLREGDEDLLPGEESLSREGDSLSLKTKDKSPNEGSQ